MRLILGTLGAFLLVPLVGGILGMLQLLYYKVRVRHGAVPAGEIPFFGALWLRGMILAFAIVAVMGVISNITQGPVSPEPASPRPR